MIAQATHITPGSFEALYIQLRTWEKRIYSDKELAQLPIIDSTHPHYIEWQLRKESSEKLIDYLKKKNRPLDILEIGCGNGWLSHRLCAIPDSKVIGSDINFTEIQQAAKVFGNIPNLHFIYGRAETGLFKDRQFDIIVFAASIQYFSSLAEIINPALKLLKANGEIHITDSHFYSLAELGAAIERSRDYYESTGFPKMADWYFHHSIDELSQYNYATLYNPNSLLNKFIRNKNPFYWTRIKS